MGDFFLSHFQSCFYTVMIFSLYLSLAVHIWDILSVYFNQEISLRHGIMAHIP